MDGRTTTYSAVAAVTLGPIVHKKIYGSNRVTARRPRFERCWYDCERVPWGGGILSAALLLCGSARSMLAHEW